MTQNEEEQSGCCVGEVCAMISKRRLTFSRAFKLFCVLVIVLAVFAIVHTRFSSSLEYQLAWPSADKARLREQSRPDTARKTARLSTPCKLYRLKGDRHTQQVTSPACRRQTPVVNSCEIAEELCHSSPPATCDHQTNHNFCTLTKNARGFGVKCDAEKCQSKLQVAVVGVQTGMLEWQTFSSTSDVEQWISWLLKPSKERKHFGFCFIGCDNFDDEISEGFENFGDDSPVGGSSQLLILPPSEQLTVPEDAGPKNQNKKEHININILFIDSVSHQHFFRSLPRTVHFLENLQSNQTSKVAVVNFELFQAVRARTFETYQALFSGEIDPSVKPFGTLEFPPKPLKVEHLLKHLKKKGYGTLWLEDLCYQWEWGLSKDLLVFNRTLAQHKLWQKFQRALASAEIDSVEVTYAMCQILNDNGVPDQFHGPDAVCENGRHQHEYMLEYLTLYQDAMQSARKPYFSILVTDVGHEGTGCRIQTLDVHLKQYLQYASTQKNTLTVVMSDHGNSYGDFLEKSEEGRVENFHPFLLMIVPEHAAASLGESGMKALHINQHRLISVLDLHYTLQAIATDFHNRVAESHIAYNVTHRGLFDEISPHRTCNEIPRIQPNLCICENFEEAVASNGYFALFAHLAVGRLNNEIHKQFHKMSLPEGVFQAYGHCQPMHLVEFKNIKMSRHQDTLSLNMDLVVEPAHQNFFVSMHMKQGNTAETTSIILEKVDRISPYSKFAVCADKTVKLQLCICNTSTTKDTPLQTELITEEDLHVNGLETEIFIAEKTDNCLLLVQQRNNYGGVFSVANVCSDKVFNFQFDLQTSAMYVSDRVPAEGTVFPGQEVFLCVAVKNAPGAKWGWSFSLRHRQG